MGQIKQIAAEVVKAAKSVLRGLVKKQQQKWVRVVK